MTPQGLSHYTDTFYKATAGLIRLAPEDKWSWKPGPENYMTLGQLCCHLTNATGECMKGLITGDWGELGGESLTPEDMTPPADKLPVCSKNEALERLEADRQLMHRLLAELPQEVLDEQHVTAPWGSEGPMWWMLLNMVDHQSNHKMQLFQYLKQLGLPVHTGHLYGM